MKKFFTFCCCVIVFLVMLLGVLLIKVDAHAAIRRQYVVVNDYVNVRAEATSDSQLLGKLYKSDRFTTTSSVTPNGFVKIRYGNRYAWVCVDYARQETLKTKVNVWMLQTDGSWKFINNETCEIFEGEVVRAAYEKIRNKSSNTEYFIVSDADNFSLMVFKGSYKKWKLYKEDVAVSGINTHNKCYTTDSKKSVIYDDSLKYSYNTHFYGHWYIHSYGLAQNEEIMAKGGSCNCIRTNPSYARWIYKYVPLGTKIYTV